MSLGQAVRSARWRGQCGSCSDHCNCSYANGACACDTTGAAGAHRPLQEGAEPALGARRRGGGWRREGGGGGGGGGCSNAGSPGWVARLTKGLLLSQPSCKRFFRGFSPHLSFEVGIFSDFF